MPWEIKIHQAPAPASAAPSASMSASASQSLHTLECPEKTFLKPAKPQNNPNLSAWDALVILQQNVDRLYLQAKTNPDKYWPRYVRAVRRFVHAQEVMLLARRVH